MIEPATFLVDDHDVPALHNVILHLASIGYCERKICERLGLSDLTEVMWRALPIYREEQLVTRDALNSAIDFFFLQGIISIDELNQVLDNNERDVLIKVGIILVHNKKCYARASLYPVGDYLVFSDHAWPQLPHPGVLNVPYDQVMYVGIDSRWLARTTVRNPVSSTLDLCTGSGVHALLASSHSKRVVAVDINPRAARCTYFNAKALGLTNIEVAVGDLFEPVYDEKFDLITANPPFVPSPVDTLGYRDGGNSGEDILRRIIVGLPNHLAPGGSAQIITELGERMDEPLSSRLRVWINGAKMDILILRLSVHSAASYSIGHANGDEDYNTFLNSVQDWSSNLRKQGYVQVVSVLITFKWSDTTQGAPWTRVEELQPPHNNAGKEVEALFIQERLSRKLNLYEILKQSKMRRAGPIGLTEARLLGSKLRTNSQANLLGSELPIFRWLNHVEGEILVLMEKPLTLSELIVITQELNFQEEDVILAIRSLIRNGFIIMT
ncbi:methyltransferase [Clostridium estertheticum]|uniref:methyltransferase n=2 Tax=Clostridium estertheticum TaxID=238834 RepID=UPI002814BFE9|nr:methyltransferase [Clostridium estertheticum]